MNILVGDILDGKAIFVCRLFPTESSTNATRACLSEFIITRAFGSARFMHAKLLAIVKIVCFLTVRDTLADLFFQNFVVVLTKFVAEDTFSQACFRDAPFFLFTECIRTGASRLLFFACASISDPL